MTTSTELEIKVSEIRDLTIEVIRAKLLEFHKDKSVSEITLDSVLIDGLGLDTVDVLELHMDLEKKFKFTGSEEVWELFNTVLGVVIYVASQLGKPKIEWDTKSTVFIARSPVFKGLIIKGDTEQEAQVAFEAATLSFLKGHVEKNSIHHLLKEHF